jgi:hypothetical protein
MEVAIAKLSIQYMETVNQRKLASSEGDRLPAPYDGRPKSSKDFVREEKKSIVKYIK